MPAVREGTRMAAPMNIITDERCLKYHQLGHPERPQRVAGTLALLRKQELFELLGDGAQSDTADYLVRRATQMFVHCEKEKHYTGFVDEMGPLFEFLFSPHGHRNPFPDEQFYETAKQKDNCNCMTEKKIK